MDLVNVCVTYKDFDKRKGEFNLIYRDSNNRNVKVIEKHNQEFLPYFYVENSDESMKIIKENSNFVRKTEEGYVSVFGDKCVKVFTCYIGRDDFNNFKRKFVKSFEADVVYRQRFIIDNNLSFTKNQRIFYIDIETSQEHEVGSKYNEILSVCCYDNFENKYHLFFHHRKFKRYFEKTKGNVKIVCCINEAHMLFRFIDFFKNNSPDIASGWFCDMFDWPTIFKRCTINGIDYREFSPFRDVIFIEKENRSENFIKINGVELLDGVKLYKKLIWSKPSSYSLNTIAEEVLKEKKVDVSETAINTVYENDLRKFLEYNMTDVKLTKKIVETLGLIEQFLSIQQLIPMPLQDIFMNSRVIDNYLLKNNHNKLVFPTKPEQEVTKAKGAYVFKPKKGLYKNVLQFDFASLYPTLMLTFNVSPDSITNKDYSGKKLEINGVFFKQDSEGVVTEMLRKLLTLRQELKDKRDSHSEKSIEYWRYHELQQAVKTIGNSVYGTMGFRSFRLYNKEALEAVTFLGRKFIKDAKNFIEKEFENCEVLYGDTDSMMVKCSVLFDEKSCIELGSTIERKLNMFFKKEIFEMTERDCKLKIEFEKYYQSFLLPKVKKKYSGLIKFEDNHEVNKFHIVGFDSIRKNPPRYSKDLERQVIEKILLGDDKTSVFDFVKNCIKDVKENIDKGNNLQLFFEKWPLNKKISDYKANSQHIRAVVNSEKLFNVKFRVGDKFYLVPLVGNNKVNSNIALKEEDLHLINDKNLTKRLDYEKIIMKNFEQRLKHVFTILDWNVDVNQTNLGDFS